ncbi:hypothetical protein Q1695_005918 [Nippostrongylus brasiliensis]|nr:hypothetical protein Q1695_005918 [Nippostrongylus brasiliensis]
MSVTVSSSVITETINTDPEYKGVLRLLEKDHRITVSEFLGKGSYSCVLKGLKGSKAPIAVKIVDTREESEYVKRFLPRESLLVKKLHHDCIIRVYQIISTPNFTTFITEFCESGDLLQKIRKLKRLSESEAKLVFRQLIEALTYLERHGIVHRDIKCENIFLDRYENVKLGDFGFARYLSHKEKSSTFCGSRAYVAPEILRSIAYTGHTVDIWSSGVVLFVMVTGVMPYDDRNPDKMVERQLAHKVRFPKSVNLTTDVKALIYEILHPYPPSRPSYRAICKSQWLRNTPYRLAGGVESETSSRITSCGVLSNSSDSCSRSRRSRRKGAESKSERVMTDKENKPPGEKPDRRAQRK